MLPVSTSTSSTQTKEVSDTKKTPNKYEALDTATAKRVALGSQETYFKKTGRLLIFPEVEGDNGYTKLLKKMVAASLGKGNTFKGTFKLRDFPAGFKSTAVDFLLLDKLTSVGDIKKELSSLMTRVGSLKEVSAESLAISYLGYVPLKDDAIFAIDLNCHGRGGENFILTKV